MCNTPTTAPNFTLISNSFDFRRHSRQHWDPITCFYSKKNNNKKKTKKLKYKKKNRIRCNILYTFECFCFVGASLSSILQFPSVCSTLQYTGVYARICSTNTGHWSLIGADHETNNKKQNC
jgi:hypothetical protein